ncbi:class I SAM-dependent methyltransferase, partial [Desulfatiglans anilini]|uniref:class I SAM-dependent methyltransferase n=1 Tax=Desulfatiglans anilini TaxID=90728 RepID=UPI00048846A5
MEGKEDAQPSPADYVRQQDGVADRITTLKGSMDALPFEEGEFDVIWSEGAVYNMGFEAGVSA